MKYTYRPKGICAANIEMEIEGNILKGVSFTGGCNGNLQAIASLVTGMPVDVVKEKLAGIRCGSKTTSCSDQLVVGIEEAILASKGENT